MSDKRRPSLADLPHHVREQLTELPTRWREWRERYRQDPALFWETPLIRLAGLVVLAIVAITALVWVVGPCSPVGGGQQSQEATPWATLYVACTNPDCRANYTTKQPMDFKDWPLECNRCGQKTVYRATRCKVCGKWFAVPPARPKLCPFCAQRKAAQQPKEPPRHQPAIGDDSEDPW